MHINELSKKLEESPRLIEELMLVIFFNSHIVDHALGANQMSVNELRFELDEMGLNVGGSKVPSRLSLILGHSMKDWVMNGNLCTNRAP